MDNKKKYVEYSKIYWDYGKASITNRTDIIMSCVLLIGILITLIIADIINYIISLKDFGSFIVITYLATVVTAILLAIYLIGGREELNKYKKEVYKLEQNLGLDFNKFKENYVFLEGYITDLKNKYKYIRDIEFSDYSFKDWQYVDIILNKFYNGIDSNYYNKLGDNTISLYRDDSISLLAINRILGNDSEYSYGKVETSLKN